jgi:hypothetical protein
MKPYFYVRTYPKKTVAGDLVECDGSVFDSLEEGLRNKPRKKPSKLRCLQFIPLADEARYRLVRTFYVPAIDLEPLVLYRWMHKRGSLRGKNVARFARHTIDYRRALRAMPLPTSLVAIPPAYPIEDIGAPEERLLTRAEALERVAALNRPTVEKRRLRSKGMYCPWIIAVELGRELPTARPQVITLGKPGSREVGTIDTSTLNPIRVLEPTEAEAAIYRIDWEQFAESEGVM